MLKILFMGTPEFGAVNLRALAASFEVVGVVTQPDRPAGRNNLLTPPLVKTAALELGLPVKQFEKLRSNAAQAELKEFAAGADIFVVAAFGMLLPQAVLDIPPLQCINVHGSLLPAYRGASPVAAAILDGLSETGVTIMLMEKSLDTGAMLTKVSVPIEPHDTQPTLMTKLAQAGANLLVSTLPDLAAGKITPEVQDNALATYTTIIKKEDGQIDWTEPAALIERKSRAYEPWPGIYTLFNKQTLKIGKCAALPADYSSLKLAPGKVDSFRYFGKPTPVVGTGSGFLALLELQLPGKKMLAATDFVRGYPQFTGAKLG